MPEASIVIPVGPNHMQIAARAYASAQAQTVPVDIHAVVDQNGLGPAWARNQGMQSVQTPWVVFLDADDELLPDFVERCLAVSEWPNQYVYTDWWQHDRHFRPSGYCWCGGQPGSWQQHNDIEHWQGGSAWHGVTTLLPSHWVRHVGGFDEAFNLGSEDTEFYWKLRTAGCCGKHLPVPLFRYNHHPNSRSTKWLKHPRFQEAMLEIRARYGGKNMGCCGRQDAKTKSAQGEKADGDILVQVLWRNKENWEGPVSGRLYPRTRYPRVIWVDPRDAQAAPNKVKRMEEEPPPPPPKSPEYLPTKQPENGDIVKVDGLRELAKAMGLVREASGIQDYVPEHEPVKPMSMSELIEAARYQLSQAEIDEFWRKRWGLNDV